MPQQFLRWSGQFLANTIEIQTFNIMLPEETNSRMEGRGAEVSELLKEIPNSG